MRPVILTTVCNRFAELDQTIASIRAQAAEFSEPPEVVVVWARPQYGRLWYFHDLMRDKRVAQVLGRPAEPGECDGCATTFYESLNLRAGLNYIKETYGPDCYVVGQAADVRARPGVYKKIDDHMAGGANAVLFHWENGISHANVWHTNFFAVRMDEAYWPPLSPSPEYGDTLETQWGKALAAADLGGVVRWHNSRGLQFEHKHESEGLPPWPLKPMVAAAGCGLAVCGPARRPWWRRLAAALGVLLRRRKS